MITRRTLALGLGLLAATAALMAGGAGAQEPVETQPEAVLVSMGAAFTYQGRLVDAGNPAAGVYDFQFRLYNAASGGGQIGAMQAVDNVGVSGGLFTVAPDFGAGAFDGQARWLEIAVKRDADASYTTLAPRVALTPAPHALALPGLWTQQNATSPNLIGGYAGNVMGAGVQGSVIAGGGLSGNPNSVYDQYNTVGGGAGNLAGSNDGSSTTQLHATVAGGSYNQATSQGATVGGGLSNDSTNIYSTVSGGFFNVASGSNATVGGGWSNESSNGYATIGGGYDNAASGSRSTVGGGESNEASNGYATIGGGYDNAASGAHATTGGGTNNLASHSYSTIGGGRGNLAGGSSATVGGGWNNLAAASYTTVAGGGPSDTVNPTTTNNRAYDDYGVVGGGGGNLAGIDDANSTNQAFATVAGGANNIAGGGLATVGGGEGNVANAGHATIGGGRFNSANSGWATVAGGRSNSAGGQYASVGGGLDNAVTASYGMVPGGRDNLAAGAYSFAAGRRAKANDNGAFVFADSTDSDFASSRADTFNVRATNGARIYANSSYDALEIYNGGSDGGGLVIQNSGGGASRASIRANNSLVGSGVAADLSSDSSLATVYVTNGGTGEVLYLQNDGDNSGSGGGDFIMAVGNLPSRVQFRVATDGAVFSDIGFFTPAADFAELLPAAPGLEPGDVLAIDPDGLLVRASEAYQSTVVGVYSTRPGFVGGMPMDGEALGKVPLAVVGVVPVKASSEGGAIRPGDPLSASNTPGHAMKAKPDAPQGTVIGKALEGMDSDIGVILVLVTLQ